MIVVKRKQIMVISAAALVAIAGYLSYSYQGMPQNETAETLGEVRLVEENEGDAQDFFSEARLEREIGRSQSVASLQSLVTDTTLSAETRQSAENSMLEIARLSEKEANAESLLRAKGFSDAVIYIHDGKVTAILKTTGLESADVAKVVDIITSQTGIPAENIQIVEAG